jgi:hypothetical protein
MAFHLLVILPSLSPNKVSTLNSTPYGAKHMTRGLGGVLTLPIRGLSSGVGLRSDLLPIYLGALGVFFRFLL